MANLQQCMPVMLRQGLTVCMQVGQFIGTRSDFIPEPICRRLSLLQDQVRLWHNSTHRIF